MDIEDRKVVIRDPKSGREAEVVFLPQKVIDRLQKNVRDNGFKQDARIFPFTYAAARLIVKLSTTQIYLGKVSDVEAIRWIF
jgi:integrase/recombinase XerD